MKRLLLAGILAAASFGALAQNSWPLMASLDRGSRAAAEPIDPWPGLPKVEAGEDRVRLAALRAVAGGG